MIQICLIGRLRSGKTTVMEFIQKIALEQYGIVLKQKRLADPIYTEAEAFYRRNGLTWVKNRRLMEGMGVAFNEHYTNGDKLLEIYQETYNPEEDIICDDARRTGQADFFKSKGWPIIRVNAPDDVRKLRCNVGEFSEGHVTDVELDDYISNFTIDNYDNTLESLYNECRDILIKIIEKYCR